MLEDPVPATFPIIPFGTIQYQGQSVASWVPATNGSNPTKGQSLSFTFDGDGSVFSAVMLIAPMSKRDATSPFNQANPIQLCQTGEDYFVSPPIVEDFGNWGFSISFMVPPTGDATGPAFYFLPDPELAVGSGPEDPR